jgi:MarR family transcriptional regulator, organic hydroperoxide resistance regulator
VTTPQLTMMLAMRDHDPKGEGLPAKEVARILGVDPTFATTQTKILEAKDFINRNASMKDGRVVYLSLSDKSMKHLNVVYQRQKKMNDYIFSEYTENGIQALATKIFCSETKNGKSECCGPDRHR